jgi:hypothetical protein
LLGELSSQLAFFDRGKLEGSPGVLNVHPTGQKFDRDSRSGQFVSTADQLGISLENEEGSVHVEDRAAGGGGGVFPIYGDRPGGLEVRDLSGFVVADQKILALEAQCTKGGSHATDEQGSAFLMLDFQPVSADLNPFFGKDTSGEKEDETTGKKKG